MAIPGSKGGWGMWSLAGQLYALLKFGGSIAKEIRRKLILGDNQRNMHSFIHQHRMPT